MTERTFDLIPGDEPLRGIVVGAGSLGPAWGRELIENPSTRLVAWIDRDVARARAAARALGRPRLLTGPDLRPFLASEAPDFVVNVTPPLVHLDVTVAALEGGVAVLTEKPLAATMAEAQRMVRAADAARRLLMVSQNRRYMPTLIAYRRTIERLGRLGALTCQFYRGSRLRPGHFLDTLDEPLLLDMAIHLFDGARALTGADPVSVYCSSWNPPGSWFRGNASANAIFEMSGGLRFSFEGSWCADGFETSWTGAWRAIGDRGTATWDGEGRARADGGPGAAIRVARPVGPAVAADRFYGLEGALAEFVAALRTGSIPQGECHDNLLSLAMSHAAVESARTGERVALGDLIADTK